MHLEIRGVPGFTNLCFLINLWHFDLLGLIGILVAKFDAYGEILTEPPLPPYSVISTKTSPSILIDSKQVPNFASIDEFGDGANDLKIFFFSGKSETV